MAEDAAQDAVEAAIKQWPLEGVPDRPGAWITTVARRRAIDNLRRQRVGRDKAAENARLLERLIKRDPHEAALTETALRDDQLRLIFGCCHPALSIEAQVALTLRCVCGLRTQEIARALLTTPATMGQRISRAKNKISTAAIPFVIPVDSELLQRTSAVRHIIYLIFNEAYLATSGEELSRADLAEEALRLGRLLTRLLPDDPELLGLLSLMCLSHARRRARTSAAGDLVLLADQDHSKWDDMLLVEGRTALESAMRLRPIGPFQLQAAIAELHTSGSQTGGTDWPQIIKLYDRLVDLQPSPVAKLNRIVAISMTLGPLSAIDELMPLAAELSQYQYFHSTLADFHRQLEQFSTAIPHYEQALSLTSLEPERRFLLGRISQCRRGDTGDSH